MNKIYTKQYLPLGKKHAEHLLVIDEIQKILHWSDEANTAIA